MGKIPLNTVFPLKSLARLSTHFHNLPLKQKEDCYCLRSQVLSIYFFFFSFLQKLGSKTDITVSIRDTPAWDYSSIPSEINYVDEYFSLNLKVVVCVFKSPESSTTNNEAKPFHSAPLSHYSCFSYRSSCTFRAATWCCGLEELTFIYFLTEELGGLFIPVEGKVSG